MREILRFQPIYQERVWGGRALASTFERQLPDGPPIGESWEIVDRPEAQSVVSGGKFNGMPISELLKKNAKAIMGPDWDPARPFPILVKWLDCRERLSLQVHPPAALAAQLKGEPKTENWYIADTAPGAQLIVGLKKGVTRADFEKAIIEQRVEDCVHSFKVAEGDSILVQSGQVHAIDAGNLILEIQQNSDSTFRVYDWARTGLDGKPRQLHVHESLQCIQWDDFEPAPVRAAPTSGVIAECDDFLIRRLVLGPGEKVRFAGKQQPRILSVVSGKLQIGGTALARGDNALLPYAGEFNGVADEFGIVLVTEDFT
ncbi:MAG: class I mannose-6-phosphate isomerase [Opitutaceae bacterium]|nr:class I mannose-6-phosphate isomerase [Opitutaceae bacterium]